MIKINVPEEIREIISCLENAGHEAYLVGGCVRDSLLGCEPADWDITTSAHPEETMAIFGSRALPTGLKYGTVSVKTPGGCVEVTTYRTDGDYTDNRRPATVGYADTLEEDLSRRDFTINAMAYSISGEIIDPFGGQRDLSSHLIRCVGIARERFEEDALRMFRCLRFAARLGFAIHPDTFSAIYEKAHLAAFLSAERINDELVKLLSCRGSYLLSSVFESGLMSSFGIGEPSVDFQSLDSLPAGGFLRLAAMCHILEKSGVIAAKGFLEDLRFDTLSIKKCSTVCRMLSQGLPDDDIGWKTLLSRSGSELCLSAAQIAGAEDGYGCIGVLERVLASGECWSMHQLAVNGHALSALGFSGKKLGAELEQLLGHVIRHPEDNDPDTLLHLAMSHLG